MADFLMPDFLPNSTHFKNNFIFKNGRKLTDKFRCQ
jgi:hypothetical protein